MYWHITASETLYRNVAITALLLAPAITFANLYQDVCRARQWLGLALLPLNVFRPVLTGVLAFCAWQYYHRPLSGDFIMSLAGISILGSLLLQSLVYHQRVRISTVPMTQRPRLPITTRRSCCARPCQCSPCAARRSPSATPTCCL